jgi:hypothetical protein
MSGNIGSVDDYIDADAYNLESVRTRLPHFNALVPPLHSLYQRSSELLPSDQLVFGRATLLCHKAFLSAAVTIARLHPDDAAAPTRRAVEAAQVCLAIKADPDNLERWKNAEHRLARWAARHEGRDPGRLKRAVKWPKDHPLFEALDRTLGTLSDLYVHFTPEYVYGQAWEHDEAAGELVNVKLAFQEKNVGRALGQLVNLARIHLHIHSVLDTCLDCRLSGDAEWERRRAIVHGNVQTLDLRAKQERSS